MKERILPPIKETSQDYAEIERKIIAVFRDELYLPIVRILGGGKRKLSNAKGDALISAIEQRKITFYRGKFTGTFTAAVSRDLRDLGAEWVKGEKAFRIHGNLLPSDVQAAIRVSYKLFEGRLDQIDARLRQILPEEIAEKIKVSKNFEKAIWKVDHSIEKTLQGITVPPELTPERRQRIADEWQENLDKYIKDFTEKQIKGLREEVLNHTFKGGRYEDLMEKIQQSYGVTERKAKFLARQETSLLMAKFKETRYAAAGVDEYIWGCVAGSPKHPVRPAHKALEGKRFRWDNPPITTAPGESPRRNNPGEDYNCRCFAKPVVKF